MAVWPSHIASLIVLSLSSLALTAPFTLLQASHPSPGPQALAVNKLKAAALAAAFASI